MDEDAEEQVHSFGRLPPVRPLPPSRRLMISGDDHHILVFCSGLVGPEVVVRTIDLAEAHHGHGLFLRLAAQLGFDS